MKINCNSFFDGSFHYLNLNDMLEFQENFENADFLNPEVIQSKLNILGTKTFGGYGENRNYMWQNTYLAQTNKFIHLGIDINAPAGTPIKCPFNCHVVNCLIDKDTEIGWGGRIILKREFCPNLVLGHIDPNTLTDKIILNKGDIIGKVGTWPANGNCFQHLHVQCVMTDFFHNLDGYGYDWQLEDNPNPFNVEWGNLNKFY